jgi:predicted HAD superfamily hydrolase
MCKDRKIYAFDFFDTLVVRDCAPELVLYEWARKMAVAVNYFASSKSIYSARKLAEKELKIQGKEEASYKELIQNTYSKLDLNLMTEDDFCTRSISIEKAIELQHCRANNVVVSKLKKANESGHYTIIVSDFYCGSEVIASIANNLGFGKYISGYYISSDIGYRKSSGKLYSYIIHDLSTDPRKIYMIGDNNVSDYKIPIGLGINAERYRSSQSEQKYSSSTFDKSISKVLFSNPLKAPFNGYIFEVLYFISSLHKCLIEQNVKDVLFCSREGQLLKKYFDYYQNWLDTDNKISSHYFYVSRVSTFLPSLSDLNDESFDTYFRQYKNSTFSEFLKSLNFYKQEINIILNELHISEDTIIESKEMALLIIKTSHTFCSLYNQRRKEQRDLFREYILRIVGKQKDIYIVDIGWKGTIQDNIQRTLGNDIKVHGFYLGLMGKQYGMRDSNLKKGLLFSDIPSKSKNYWIFQKRYAFYEKIFTANHGPTISYQEVDGDIVPKLKDWNDKDKALYDFVSPFQNEMYMGYKEILDIFRYNAGLPYEDDYFLARSSLYKQVCFYPKISKIEENSRKLFVDNFGSFGNPSKTVDKKNISGDFFYADYTYRFLDKLHLRILHPLADLYCNIAYIIKKRSIEK